MQKETEGSVEKMSVHVWGCSSAMQYFASQQGVDGPYISSGGTCGSAESCWTSDSAD